MKKILFFAMIMASASAGIYAAQHTITNVGTSFSPDSLTIDAGDTITFSLGSIHNAVEVTHETYNANGTISNEGFSVPMGGGTVVFPNVGTYYYVCQPHASLGMKGIINVVSPTGVVSPSIGIPEVVVFPNPAKDIIAISYTLISVAQVNIRLITITGAEVASLLDEKQNAGMHQSSFTFNSAFNPGIYFLSVNTDNNSYVKKIIIE
jgi:plastocyanin